MICHNYVAIRKVRSDLDQVIINRQPRTRTNQLNKVIDINQLKTSCKNCSLSDLCLPHGLEPDDLKKLDSVVKQKTPIQAGSHLFREDHQGKAIFAIRSGALKSYQVAKDGTEHVLGFHLPGELVGFDYLADDSHHCSAMALVTSSVCELPMSNIDRLCGDIPGLQRQLIRIMSGEMNADRDLLFMLARKSAEERLASFLLSLSSRYQKRGLSGAEFILPMSRTDIASYLGLTTETVSRLFSHFQEQGLLAVERKSIIIRDIERLRNLVSGCASNTDNAISGTI